MAYVRLTCSRTFVPRARTQLPQVAHLIDHPETPALLGEGTARTCPERLRDAAVSCRSHITSRWARSARSRMSPGVPACTEHVVASFAPRGEGLQQPGTVKPSPRGAVFHEVPERRQVIVETEHGGEGRGYGRGVPNSSMAMWRLIRSASTAVAALQEHADGSARRSAQSCQSPARRRRRGTRC